jgi:integrase
MAGTFFGGSGRRSSFERSRALVLDSLSSPHSKRVFAAGLAAFRSWAASAGRPRFDKAAAQAFRAHLEARRLAPATINVYHLSAIRRLAGEATEQGWLDARPASGIAKVKGPRRQGTREGRWLAPVQARELLRLPDLARLKDARDRAALALLIGCGLRRAELCRLGVGDLKLREGRWVIADLAGKGRKLRTVPVPNWVKAAIDCWKERAGIAEGRLLRPVNRADQPWGEGISEDTVWAITREYGARIGEPELAPHDLRRTCARLCRNCGGRLEQIQMLLGHASILTTERYLGVGQDLAPAVNDNLPIRSGKRARVARKAPRSETRVSAARAVHTPRAQSGRRFTSGSTPSAVPPQRRRTRAARGRVG